MEAKGQVIQALSLAPKSYKLHFSTFLAPWGVITKANTAGINRSNTAVRAVLEQPCSTGGRTGTVRPKHLPAGRTGLSDQFLGPVAQDQPGPVGQICPTSWLLLWSDRPVRSVPGTGRTGPAGTGRTNLSDQLALASVGQCLSDHRSNSACPTTGRTRLFEHRSNCRVRPVNAGSATFVDLIWLTCIHSQGTMLRQAFILVEMKIALIEGYRTIVGDFVSVVEMLSVPQVQNERGRAMRFPSGTRDMRGCTMLTMKQNRHMNSPKLQSKSYQLKCTGSLVQTNHSKPQFQWSL
ncbi:hypothetical protein PCANC_24354 [Puccinia coronata f. sp. avenae]|uniref:Uncharacterized protein n=1 Tax=Puccinia coronata f. sp. avenae TaxID=200324 RepID=A0A2N5U318_9BASI|nr:hypothetical protein PCASD_23311 [Puccinia coronata f. sp. avenae]PLW32131.1 hypothetical protein PCANC_24354 [Puccinia coronata f. sp. avenae]